MFTYILRTPFEEPRTVELDLSHRAIGLLAKRLPGGLAENTHVIDGRVAIELPANLAKSTDAATIGLLLLEAYEKHQGD